MKNSLLLLLILLSVSLFSENIDSIDFDTSYLNPKRMERISTFENSTHNRNVPDIGFSQPPIALMQSYYRYMIGGYKSAPIVKQPAVSEPMGYQADGIYLSYMAKVELNSERRVYYSYINNSGNVSTPAPIANTNIWEGFMSLDIDPVTGNPLIAWHQNIDADNSLEVMFSYDKFNVVGTPGLWQEPTILIDNPVEGTLPGSGYNWPVLRVGPSPIEGKRRVHIFADLNPISTDQSTDCIYGHADFHFDDSIFDFVFEEWSFQTFPIFEEWAVSGVRKPLKDFVVSDEDGTIAFVGFTEDSYFAVVSSDYGESFETNIFDAKVPVFNPQNQDGSYMFINEDGSPAEVFLVPSPMGGHFNAKYSAENQSAVFLSAIGITTAEALEMNYYFLAFFYPKVFRYDFVENEYSIVDIQTLGIFSPVFVPEAPWDLDGDGMVDEFDEEGNVMIADSCPSYYYNGDLQDSFFHESLFKIATTESGEYQIAVFQDCRKHRKAFHEVPGYEDWLEIAEIAVCVSNDFGETWSDPAYLNAKPDDENFYSELEGMYPCYIYPTEDIVLEDGMLQVPIMFLNDSAYGGYYLHLPNDPASVTYAVLSIDPIYTSYEEPNIPAITISLTNYPNPFNPRTEISFSLNTEITEITEIEIFNIKGQKIKSFLVTLSGVEGRTNTHSVTWNGTDSKNNPLSSGVYFATLKSKDKILASRKMLLLK